jgi:chemotaxis signal transduction protein
VTSADQVVVLEAAGQRFGVDLRAVERVHPVESITVLPGLRPPWRGLVALRGEILPALDVGSYLGVAPPAGTTGGGPVGGAVVAGGGRRLVLLSEAPVTLARRAAGGTMLDVATILADPGLEVDD